MFIGIDLGTSAVKCLLVDAAEKTIAATAEPLSVARPSPSFSEQDPEDWRRATLAAFDRLAAEAPAAMAAVTGIGLSGQMHGAVLLDAADRVLRPCILWNDGRAEAECAELMAALPDLPQRAGTIAMPGFTAPKLLWVRRHEPALFAAIRRVLLPKAYLRLWLSGEAIEDMSDASGSLWLDVAARAWSEAALLATGLTRDHMPDLVEGPAQAGRLRADLVRRWGLAKAPVIAGGAGDNAAGAIGLGAIAPGDAFVSLGTSGVLWATNAGFSPNPAAAIHAYCHALPQTWHQMGVVLSAAASLGWLARTLNCREEELLTELGKARHRPGRVLFLPYLSGERTPHNDARVRGAFAGLAQDCDRADLTLAILEGVAFAIKDCALALKAAGTALTHLDAIGGGARSPLWLSILADILDLPISPVLDAELGAAFGAARLGRMAATGEMPAAICRKARRGAAVLPDPARRDSYADCHDRYRRLYPALKEIAA